MYNYKTPEYERYVAVHNANVASGGMDDTEAEALAAAQKAALAWEQRAWTAYSA